MRQHFWIWVLTVATVVVALAVYAFRSGETPGPPQFPEAPETVVLEALDLLEIDPKAFQADTQRAVRKAAVLVDEGYVRGAGAYHVLGMQYVREHNAASAEALFKRAVATAPDWAVPYRALGDLVGRHTPERREEAEDYLRQAIELAPQWALPYDSLAVLLRHSGRLHEAEEFALLALEINPEDVATQNNYANLLFELGRYPEAEIHYLEAIRVNPDHPKPYYNLACFYSLTGQAQKSLEHLEQAFLLAPVLRVEAARDPDLAPIRSDPAFERMIRGGRADENEAAAPPEGEPPQDSE